MDPNAGLKPCQRCKAGIWFESPAFPLCETCFSQQDAPALSAPVETAEDAAEIPGVIRPPAKSRRAKSVKDNPL